MNDYISREAALNFEAEITAAPSEIQAISQGMSLYAEHIKAIPAADVAPVVHAEWVVSRTDRGWNGSEYPTHCKCTHCGRELPYLDRDNYCPTCGAVMDGGTQDA